jgi:hypothetical protein
MIDRRSLFVGGAVAVSVGSVPAVEASEAELSERLPSFEFLGHRIGDSIHEIFPAPGGRLKGQTVLYERGRQGLLLR